MPPNDKQTPVSPAKKPREKTRVAALGRSATREVRRQQLIDATIDCLARYGFADITMAQVAEAAGLSQGIINFHFRSKETLLLETLAFMDREYRETWQRALSAAGAGPRDRLLALLCSEFDPAICNRKKIAVWHAFYGEAKARPTYRKLCGERDETRRQAMREILVALTRDEVSRPDCNALADALCALTDGFWLDFHLSTGRIDRAAARDAVQVLLAGLFPQHY